MVPWAAAAVRLLCGAVTLGKRPDMRTGERAGDGRPRALVGEEHIGAGGRREDGLRAEHAGLGAPV